jgi:hypothetical protein
MKHRFKTNNADALVDALVRDVTKASAIDFAKSKT